MTIWFTPNVSKPNMAIEQATFLPHIREILVSNIIPETFYSDFRYVLVSICPSRKRHDITSNYAKTGSFHRFSEAPFTNYLTIRIRMQRRRASLNKP